VSASFDTQGRDAYWHATQSELKSIRRRGDIVTLTGAAVLLALIFFYRDHSQELAAWLVGGALLLAVIGASLWFVTSRTRRVAIARGLVCSRCSYMPHDTEIDEVATTRTCPRCEQSLDG
jgi:Na+/proline symporter